MSTFCAVFDLDGTLFDSSEGIVLSTQHGLTSVGAPLADPQVLRSYIGISLLDAYIDLGLDSERAEKAVLAYRERMSAVGIYESSMYEGVPELLETLKEDGWKLAVATSKLPSFAEKLIKHFDLTNYFDHIAGALTDDLRHQKGLIMQRAIDAVGVAPNRAVMIGDRREDLMGAEMCGMASVAVAWGFGDKSEFSVPGLLGNADTPIDVLKILSEWTSGQDVAVERNAIDMQSPLEVANSYFEFSNRSDFKSIATLFTDVTTYSSQNTGIYLGKDDIIAMQKAFHGKFDLLSWRVNSVAEIKAGVILFDYDFTGMMSNGEVVSSSGFESIVVHAGLIQHIEIRNK